MGRNSTFIVSPVDKGEMPIMVPLSLRLLLIEDNAERITRFREWLVGTQFVVIEASSGGRAKGLLRKGWTDGIAGIMLDHDLEQQPVIPSDLTLSASNLLNSIVPSIPRSIPILIHSMNVDKPPQMQKHLQSSGFSVPRIRMSDLTRESFHEWLQDVMDNWEDRE